MKKSEVTWLATMTSLLYSQVINYGDGTGYQGKDKVGNLVSLLEEACSNIECGRYEVAWVEGGCGLEGCDISILVASGPSLTLPHCL